MLRALIMVSVALAMVLGGARLAEARRLGKTVGGIRGKSGGGSKRPSGGVSRPASGGHGSSSGSGHHHHGLRGPGWTPAWGWYGYGYGYGSTRAASNPGMTPLRVHAYGGLQSVEGSDGALTGELHVTGVTVGLTGHVTSFWERPDAGSNLTTRLDLFTVGLEVLVTGDGSTSLWLEADYAGLRGSPDVRLSGFAGGGRLQHDLGGSLAVFAGVRGYVFPDVKALELQAGFQAAIFRVSYRVVDFDVGPPLGGPEVGVAFSF